MSSRLLSCKKSSGFSLLELLLALFIFTTVLLTITRLELAAWRYEQAAYWRSVAVSRVMELAENLQACGSKRNNSLCWIDSISTWQSENTNYLIKVKDELKLFPNYYQIDLSSQLPSFDGSKNPVQTSNTLHITTFVSS